MLKFAPLFLIIAIAAGVYSLYSSAVLPKILFFSVLMVLFVSLLGRKRLA
ncbi:MAG TPA: hypothetical protein VKR32_09395 [Puia sp.]|nr:hypothetical protein [Puia sp.]